MANLNGRSLILRGSKGRGEGGGAKAQIYLTDFIILE